MTKKEIEKKIEKWIEENKYNIVLTQDERGNQTSGDFIRIIEFNEFLKNLFI